MLINKRMELGLFKGFSKASVLLAVILLVACSPKLDWRTVQSPQEGYTALFPGKPDKLERHIPYQEQELQQTLEAVKVDDDIYSITTIKVPVSQAAATEKIITQLKANLLDRAKATGGSVDEESATYQTISRQRLATKDYFVSIKANNKVQQLMRVRWITRQMTSGDSLIYQVSVLHTSPSTDNAKALLSKEEYANFFDEFYPE